MNWDVQKSVWDINLAIEIWREVVARVREVALERPNHTKQLRILLWRGP